MTRALLVRVAGRDLAVDASCVRGAAEIEQVTKLPRSPEVLLGLLASRGDLVPLLDLGRALGSSTPDFLGRRALIVEARGERFAFPLEDVLGFANLDLGAPADFTDGTDGVTSSPTEVDGRLVETLWLDRAFDTFARSVTLN